MITLGRMVHWITLLSIVKILAQAHNACKRGKLVYERIPGHRLDNGFEEHTYEEITDPSIVMSTCMELCQNDRLDTGDVNPCKGFNFKTLSSKTRLTDVDELWRTSTCSFPKLVIQETEEEKEKSSLVKDPYFDHFVEICVNETEVLEQNCPNKTHIFTVFPGIMFSPGNEKKLRGISSREECENSCLRETEFTCRSANYETSSETCSLSAYTIRMKSASKTVKRNPNFEYLENNCLKGSNRCEGIASFIKEEHKEMPRNKDLLSLHNIEETECRRICRDDKGELPFLCHSFHYNPVEKLCLLSEDYFSDDNNGIVTSRSLSYHEVVCIQGGENTEWDRKSDGILTTDASNLEPSSSDQTFELFRNYNIDAIFYSQFSDYDLGRCLDECLHSEGSLKCKSLVYNPKTMECRMSRRNTDGTKLYFDDEYNYYENLKYSKPSGHKNIKWPKGSESRHHFLGQFPNRNEDGSYYSNYGGAYQPSPGHNSHQGATGWGQEKEGEHRLDWNPDPSWNSRPNYDHGYQGQSWGSQDFHGNRPSGGDDGPGWTSGSSTSWNSDNRFSKDDESSGNDGQSPASVPVSSHQGGNNWISASRGDGHHFQHQGHGSQAPQYPNHPHWANQNSWSNDVDSSGNHHHGSLPHHDPNSGHRFETHQGSGGDQSGGSYAGQGGFPLTHGPGTSPQRPPYFQPEEHSGSDGWSSSLGNKGGHIHGGISSSGQGGSYPNHGFRPVASGGNNIHGHFGSEPGDGSQGGASSSTNHGGTFNNHGGSNGFQGSQAINPGSGGLSHGAHEGFASGGSGSSHGQGFRPHGGRPSGSHGNSFSGGSGISVGNTVRRPRCEPGEDKFKQIRSRAQLRSQHVKREESVNSLGECEEACIKVTGFKCRSFNFVSGFSPLSTQNCELSDFSLDIGDLNDPKYFTISETHDFYVREPPSDECLDVSQTCTENEMVFTLRTPSAFRGRIYTYRHYDKEQCFISGTGGNVHVLRISGASAYPNCGTLKYGNTQTNVVIVQHSELVQTSRDVIYNLTCTVQNPGEAIVSSGYIGSTYIGSGSLGEGTEDGKGGGGIKGDGGIGGHGSGFGFGIPIPIEYLPAEHTLDSRVRLVISYQGRPTTTIAVGDPLEFKIETQDGENLIRDIFATNVVAKDPYSQRAIRLIDNRGCPIDSEVFPALGLSQSGNGLKTHFNAFKIPESNFLVFEANIRTCRGGCPPVDCQGPRGRELSYGKRRRRRDASNTNETKISSEDDIDIKEMFKVFDTREEIIIDEKPSVTEKIIPLPSETTCKGEGINIALIVILVGLVLLVIGETFYVLSVIRNRKLYQTSDLISVAENCNPALETKKSYLHCDRRRPKRNNGLRFEDPSEPIYTDPTLFERSGNKSSRNNSSPIE